MDAQTFLQDTRKTFLDSNNPFALLCLILLSIAITLNIKTRKLKVPPSPPKLPFIGNLHQISSLPHTTFRMLSEKYGPLMLLHLGRVPILVVSSLDIAKEIFGSHDHAFADRPSVTGLSIVFKDSPDMALGPYSDRSKETKKQCILQLLSQRRVQQLEFIRKEEVEKVMVKIRILSGTGCAFNISDLFISLAQNILCRSAFGSLYGNENEKNFGQVSRRTMDLISAFCFKDAFPFLGWIDHLTGLIGNLKKVSEELHNFLDQVIEYRLALMNDDDDRGEEVEDKKYLVDILLCSRKEGLSMHSLKTILMDMIIGGIDTIATAMEWMMAELMKNPSIRKKAQEEVRRVVGKKSEITQADIQEMKYLKCIIKENVRLHGSGLMPRQTSSNVKLQGYEIPAKSRVLVNVWAIQRDPQLWDRPEDFIPERFLSSDDDDDISPKNEQVLFSFGGGKRRCPGMPYAYAEIEIIFANLLFWFDWELDDALDMKEVHTFAIRKKYPVSVVAHPHFP